MILFMIQGNSQNTTHNFLSKQTTVLQATEGILSKEKLPSLSRQQEQCEAMMENSLDSNGNYWNIYQKKKS